MTLTFLLSLIRGLAEGSVDGTPPVDAFWGWVGSSIPAGALLNGLGLGVLAVLFARDLILTRGQHSRRVADLERAYQAQIDTLTTANAEVVRIMGDNHKAAIAELTSHHAALIAVKDAQYADMRERMNYYRDARLVEQERNTKLTDQLAETTEAVKVSAYVLQAIDQAAKDAS